MRPQSRGSVSGASNSSTSGVASGFFNCHPRRRYNAGPIFFLGETSMRILIVLFCAVLMIPFAVAQQDQSQDTTSENAKQAASKKDKKQPTSASSATPDKSAESGKPAEPSESANRRSRRQGRTLRCSGSPARNHASPDRPQRQDSQLHSDSRKASPQARRRQDRSRNVLRRLHARWTGSRQASADIRV